MPSNDPRSDNSGDKHIDKDKKTKIGTELMFEDVPLLDHSPEDVFRDANLLVYINISRTDFYIHDLAISSSSFIVPLFQSQVKQTTILPLPHKTKHVLNRIITGSHMCVCAH